MTDKKQIPWNKNMKMKPKGKTSFNRGGKAGAIQWCYERIEELGPQTTYELYVYLLDEVNEVSISRAISSLQQFSQILTRSRILKKIGTTKQHSPRLLTVAPVVAPSAKQTVPIWDTVDLDELAEKIISYKHPRSINRLPAILQYKIEQKKKEMEEGA